MSYMRERPMFGLGHGYIGGMGNLGDDYVIDWSRADSSVLALQQELQRLGFLATGSGQHGADGKWGPRSEHALVMAANYVDWQGDPFTARYTNSDHSRGSVTIPAELVSRLRSAAPAPRDTPGRVIDPSAPPPVVEEPRIIIGPHLDPPGGWNREREPLPWWPWLLIGGGVLMMGGAAAWIVGRKTTSRRSTAPTRVPTRRSQMATVVPNRRRRRRSRR